MTSFWKKTASQMKGTPNPEWVELLRTNMQTCQSEKLAELEKSGDLEAYLTVRVLMAQEDLRTMLQAGMDPQTDMELVMQDLLQQAETDQDHPEPWEIEGSTADMEAAMENRLLNP